MSEIDHPPADPERPSMTKPEKDIWRPTFCPKCGEEIAAVRHIMGNMFECGCAKCGATCVILSNDHERFHL